MGDRGWGEGVGGRRVELIGEQSALMGSTYLYPHYVFLPEKSGRSQQYIMLKEL